MLISSQNTISTGQESVWIVYNSQGQLLVEITGRRGGEAHRHKLNLTRRNPGHQQKQPDHCHEWGKVPHGEVANKIQNDHFNKISSSWQLHLQINLKISCHFWPFLVTVWKKNLPKNLTCPAGVAMSFQPLGATSRHIPRVSQIYPLEVDNPNLSQTSNGPERMQALGSFCWNCCWCFSWESYYRIHYITQNIYVVVYLFLYNIFWGGRSLP